MLSPQAVKSIIQTRLTDALGRESSALSGYRIDALKRYRGEPDGKEREGHSAVVWRDVSESIDTTLPQLMKIFAGGDQIGAFQPHGPEDEQGADQATDYVNWIWSTQNNGPIIIHSWLKDGLLQRLGVVKVWWDTQKRRRRETYRGLTKAEFDALDIGDDDRVVSVDWRDPDEAEGPDEPPEPAEPVAVPTDQPPPLSPLAAAQPSAPRPDVSMPAAAMPPEPPAPGMIRRLLGAVLPTPVPAAPERVADVVIERVESEGCVKIQVIPPEDFGCDPRATSDEDMEFAFHRCRKTVSDLIEMGVPKAKARSLQTGDDDLDTEKQERDEPEFGQAVTHSDQTNIDPSMRSVWVAECYIRVDEDEDGIAEWRKITVAGPTTGVEILFDEEVDGHPFCSWTPFPTPHKLIGESLDDKVGDIQQIKTALIRQVLDNLYLTNNPGLGVTERVNLGDALDREIGGVVRVEDQAGPVGNHIMPITVPFTAGASLGVMEYIDQAKEMRTGVSRLTQGLDPNAINKTATGVNAITNFSQDRQALIARIFAETGLKRAFKKTLELVCKYQEKAKVIRLRNKWVPMDPTSWSDQMDFTVTVGIGTGNKDQMLMHLQQILAIQVQAIQFQGGVNGPLVTLPNLFNTVSKMVENAGLKAPELYFTDPAQAQQAPQQPKPDPAMMQAQAALQIKAQTAQADMQLSQQRAQQQAQLDQQKLAAQIQAEQMKAQAQIEVARQKAAAEIEIARMKAQAQAEIDRMKAATDAERKDRELQAEGALEAAKVALGQTGPANIPAPQ